MRQHEDYVYILANRFPREEQLKGWLRVKKIALVVRHNLTWRDLGEDWGKLFQPFDEAKMRAAATF